MPIERWQWQPLQRRVRGRTEKAWLNEVTEAMQIQNEEEGDWEDRTAWRE